MDYVDTWKGMEKCVADKLTRSIGVSNFNIEQMKRVQAIAQVPISVNQVMPGWNQHGTDPRNSFPKL